MNKKWKERCSIALVVLGLFAMSCDSFFVMLTGAAMLAVGMLGIAILEEAYER